MRASPNLLRAGAILTTIVVGAIVAFALVAALRPRGYVSGLPPIEEAGDFRPASEAVDAEPVELRLESPGTEPVALPPLTEADLAVVKAAVPRVLPPAPKPKGIPRVNFVSQFDGGDLQGANCTLASGAMLAELAFGVRTTGSILRKQQNDQRDGTGLDDLRLALRNAFGKRIEIGSLTVETLRRLLGSGYGVVLQGLYARVPPSHSLQPSFRSWHAIYIDGFVPADARHPSLYYVMDPIARQHSGYDGDWWPASIIEDFAAALAGPGRASAAWAPARAGLGAVQPIDPAFVELPPSGDDPPGSGSGDGDGQPGPGGDVGTKKPAVPPSTPTVVRDPGSAPGIGLARVEPGLMLCVLAPVQAGCPAGVPAVAAVGSTSSGPSPPAVNVVFVDSDEPNAAFVGFTAPDGANSTVFFWGADDPNAPIEEATSVGFVDLVDRPSFVARLDVQGDTRYQFVVMVTTDQGTAYSPVGAFTSGPGLKLVRATLGAATLPATIHDSLLSPYSEVTASAIAMPFLPCTGSVAALVGTCAVADAASVQCSALATFAGSAYCQPATQLRLPAIEACRTATVSYEISGLAVTGVRILAYPTLAGVLPDGSVASTAAIEAMGPPGAGSVQVGCLAQGLTYTATIDAIGDDRGPLYSVTLAP